MTPMIGAMSDNVANYRAVASLPSFPLFPWFFVIPGVLVAVLALAAGTRRTETRETGVESDPELEPVAPPPLTVPKGAA